MLYYFSGLSSADDRHVVLTHCERDSVELGDHKSPESYWASAAAALTQFLSILIPVFGRDGATT